MTAFVRLEGYALHAGIMTAVTLMKRPGPITLEQGSRRTLLRDLIVGRTDGGVTVRDEGGLEVDLVEHLLSALGGLAIRQGVGIVVEGPEMPILDGGARQFADALIALDLPADPPELIVKRQGEIAWGASAYRFDVGRFAEVIVETSFEPRGIGAEEARWDGTARAFLADIAEARTFGFQSDQVAYFERQRALLAKRTDDPAAVRAFTEAVVVFDHDGRPLAGSAPPRALEVPRHKLLDLIGDFALYGGPPRGVVSARLPGHAASHRIIREALSLGLLSQT